MKNYLERLAAQAIGRGGGIHPLVGSIYAGSSGDVASDALVPEEERVIVRERRTTQREGAEPRLPEAQIPGDVEERRVVRASAPERESQAPAEPAAAFKPLVRKARAEAEFLPVRAEMRESEPARKRMLSAQEADQQSDKWTGYSPLLPQEQRKVFVTTAAPRQEVPLRAADSGREPEPIQIHIGRIEVTALPEVQRPAARARKSLDLGEYLKRRDGRTG